VFARTQILDQLEVGESLVAPLELGHEARQDADHAPTASQRAVGECTHRADGAATVDDSYALCREHLAEASRRRAVVRMGAATRGAIHADGALDGRYRRYRAHAGTPRASAQECPQAPLFPSRPHCTKRFLSHDPAANIL